MKQRRKWALVGLGLFGWLLVLVASNGERPAEKAWLGIAGLEVAYMITMFVLALTGLILIIVAKPFSEWQPRERQRRRGMGFLLFLAIVLLIWRPDLISKLELELAGPETDESEEIVAADEAAEGAEPGPEPVAQLTDILLVVVALGAAGVAVFLIRRRLAPEELEPVPLAASPELLQAIDVASGQLRMSATPRQAVLLAYATLEDSLAEHRVVRDLAETPTEHMARVFAELPVDVGPFVNLGSLYERARFSSQDITVADQEQAAVSLNAARDALAVVLVDTAEAHQ